MATSPSKAEIGLPLELQTALDSPQNSGMAAGEISVPGRDALQALLAFSALHEQVKQRRAREATLGGGTASSGENPDQFLLFEVLQLVAERALALTGADGVAIALVHEGEIICRAAAGPIVPDVGVKLDLDAGFSGFCLRTGQSIRCDNAETDPRVNHQVSQRLNAKSMLAVPLCGRRTVVGLIEAFSTEAYGFDDNDLGSLKLLAELILGAMKPEEQNQFENLSPVAVHGRKLASEPRLHAGQSLGIQAPERIPAVGAAELDRLIREQVKAAAAPVDALVPTVAVPAEKSMSDASDEAPASEGPIEHDSSHEVSGVIENQESCQDQAVPPAPVADKKPTRWPAILVVAGLAATALLLAAGLWWRLHRRTASVEAAPSGFPSQASSSVAVPGLRQNAPEATSAANILPPSPTPTAGADVSETASQRGLLPLITGVRHWESGDSTTVVIDLQDQVQYEVHRLTDPERIYFDLHDTLLPASLSGRTIEVGDALLVRIRIAQPMVGVSRIVLETKDVSTFSVSLEQNPFRLVAAIRKQAPERKLSRGLPQNYLQQQGEDLTTGGVSTSKEDLQLRARVPHLKITLDAGHGGWDLGTVGREGLLEKDLVFDVVQRLSGLLKKHLGSEVIYTRPDDNYVPLERRAEIANEAESDLFVSVHANYSEYAFARGVETYYTNFSSSAESAAIEMRENATAKSVPATSPLTGVALKERTEESRRLAASVERSLFGTLAASSPGLRDRGVRQAGFVVLTGTSMPAILSEISFVSSPVDEKNLLSAAYREKIAEALYKGIARYAAGSSRVKMAAATGKPSGR